MRAGSRKLAVPKDVRTLESSVKLPLTSATLTWQQLIRAFAFLYGS